MSDRDSIIDKIRKLLDHTTDNGATEAEAVAFALKAQKLIAEHDVQKWEIYEELSEEIVEMIADIPSFRVWRCELAEAIADNFRCISYQQYMYVGKRRRVPYIMFCGRCSDAAAASMVFSHLYRVGDEIGRKVKRKTGNSNAYDSFCFGFCAGVRSELEKQSKALMLVRHKSVDDFYENLELSSATYYQCNSFDGEIFEYGKDEGKRSVRAARIEQSETLAIEMGDKL